MFRCVGIALCALIGGCGDVANSTVAEPASLLSETVFRCNVEPVLVRQCSFNACHGLAESPLRVYSPGKLRMKPPGKLEDSTAALTDAEHHANFLAATGFVFSTDVVDDNWLLRKPLPSTFGGYEHKGGAIFSDTTDPQYLAIRNWLTGKGTCQ